MVPVDDESALTMAIDSVFDDSEAMNTLADNGRLTVIERYTEQQVLTQYQALIDKLCGDGLDE